MRIKIIPLAVVVLAGFAFGIVGASVLGYWVTESTKIPAKMAAGEFAGQSDPADIRGSYTFRDVENAFGVPASILAEAFGMTDRPAAEVKAKDLETAYAGKTGSLEVGTDSVRLFVAAWKGLPFEPEPTTALPVGAVSILAARDLPPAVVALVRSRALPGGAGFGSLSAAPPAAAPVPAVSGTAPPAGGNGTASAVREVKGQTTFGDLYAWGLSAALVREALGGRDPGAATQTVRDFCLAAGIEFSDVRVRLQGMAADLTKP